MNANPYAILSKVKVFFYESLHSIFFLVFLLIICKFTGCATIPQKQTQKRTEISKTVSFQEAGLELLGVRLSAAGYMLDFRYRVIDPEKASLLANHRINPYLIDKASGAKLFVPSPPKAGPMHQLLAKPIAGRNVFHFVCQSRPIY